MEVIFKPKFLSRSNWRYVFRIIWVLFWLLTPDFVLLMMVLSKQDTSVIVIGLIVLLSISIILFVWSLVNDQQEVLVSGNGQLILNKRGILSKSKTKIDLSGSIKIKFTQYEQLYKPLVPFQREYIFEFTEAVNKDTPKLYSEKTSTIVLRHWDQQSIEEVIKHIKTNFRNIQWI